MSKSSLINLPLWGTWVLRLLNWSMRWTWVGFEGEEALWTTQPPRIIAFWHGRQMMMPFVYLNRRRGLDSAAMTVLSSEHADGRMMARALNYLGIRSVFGSSTRGGREALFGMIRALENGSHIALTPDGPKGPVKEVKAGTLRIAQRTGALIYPLGISFSWAKEFNSWDRMLLPYPFSRAVVVKGEPIRVPAKASADELEALRVKLEQAINEVTDQADAMIRGQES